MILPTVIRTSEEAIKAVPNSYREGSLALGAGKWYTIRKVVIPSAKRGILTGVILGMSRAVGETAALMLTAGSALGIATNLFRPARTLAVHLYVLATEGLSMERAYATATVLFVLIFLMNLISTKIIEGKKEDGREPFYKRISLKVRKEKTASPKETKKA